MKARPTAKDVEAEIERVIHCSGGDVVFVEDEVFLRGAVNSSAEREEAERAARCVVDLSKVINQLVVAQPERVRDRRSRLRGKPRVVPRQRSSRMDFSMNLRRQAGEAYDENRHRVSHWHDGASGEARKPPEP